MSTDQISLDPEAAAALADLVSAGAPLALLTGNLEPIGHDKMAQAGLGDFFRPGEGSCARAETA